MSINKLIGYFDILAEHRPGEPRALAKSANDLHWLPQWLALLAGVITEKFYSNYLVSHTWSLNGFWGWSAFALIVSIIIFPAVYEKSFDPDRPLFVQLCSIFCMGIGWHAIVDAAGKATAA